MEDITVAAATADTGIAAAVGAMAAAGINTTKDRTVSGAVGNKIT
jgi:hypothetical protein